MDMSLFVNYFAQCAPGFLLALVCHEYAHGWVAKKFGDDTAEREGRLTFNPASHIDPMGTIIFPSVLVLFAALSGTPPNAFGWARPVPVSARNFKNIRKGIFWVSFAGPLANFALGIISSFLFVVLLKYVYPEILLQIIKYPELIHSNLPPVVAMLKFSIFINFILMGFNLIPLPPLDGSRMVATYLKGETLRKYEEFARYTPMIFIGAIFLSSFTGISIFGFLLWPFMQFSEFTVQLMFRIF